MDRSLLHFPEQVQRSFAFVEAFGFRCVHSEPTLMRYESQVMAICIYQGRQSYEVDLAIESRHGEVKSYSFSEILRLVCIKRGKDYRNFTARNAEAVAEGVRRLATLFRECIDAGILSAPQLFARLERQRNDSSRNYALEVQLEQVHSKLASAWAKRDFERVVHILSPLQEHLNRSDLRKLEYAKKQL